MTSTSIFRSLPALLTIDAVSCAVMGIGLAAAADPISAWTNLPSPLLVWAGLLLLPIAAFMGAVGRLTPVPGWASAIVILGNCGWIAASFALPFAGLIAPNPLGWTFLIAQAAFVALMAFAEFNADRTTPVLA